MINKINVGKNRKRFRVSEKINACDGRKKKTEK